ncbi:hypothetical protein [Streptomyces alkaliterrae]|uniref:Repetin n=1 Tax=Streptomyces alkaliterrae TaxID=2213162 RepID=A0A5P0YL72_9ACTN|nr:hypothetical protein [Streptomyces alkaliterrae]MBB1259593.1 hypothetical protein [Streptomyces alkaliterrae]MQS00981.1 hypothetical protein [Streptomyces alkaliterrae]
MSVLPQPRRAVGIALGTLALSATLVAPALAGDTAERRTTDRVEAASDPEPRLRGTAKLHRPEGHVIHFTFDGRGGGMDTRGTFRFSHYAGDEGAYAVGRLDCMISGGGVTTASGVITRSDLKGAKGKRVGFSVTDDGTRLGYSWAMTGSPAATKDLPPCAASAPFERVESGGFEVVPWDPWQQ